MQGLYPIIRRQRRPLIVLDVPPVVVGNVEPVNAEAGHAEIATEAKHVEDACTPPAPLKETD